MLRSLAAIMANKKWFGKLSRSPQPIRRDRLFAEVLEARDVPAAFTWVPTDPGVFNWSDAANWTAVPTGTFPNAADDTATIATVLTGDQTIAINGAITVDSLTIGATGGGGVYALNFTATGTTPGTEYSQIISTGTVTLTEAELDGTIGFAAAPGTSFTIIDATNPVVGTFVGLAEGATFTASGQLFQITYQGGSDGNDIVVTRVNAPVFTSSASAIFYSGIINSFNVTATGSPQVTFDIAAGSTLPDGVSLGPLGVMIGVSTITPGTYTFDIEASNTVGSATQPFTLTVATPVSPLFTSGVSATFLTGVGGTFTVTADGDPAPTFSISSGSLPTGTTLDAVSGVLTVGPTTAPGEYSFGITAENQFGTDTQSFALSVEGPPVFTSTDATTFFTGMSNTFTATVDGFPASTFTVTAGTLPSGVTLSDEGVLSGVPGATGSFPITITADNGVGPSIAQDFTLSVVAGIAPNMTSPNNTVSITGTGGTFTFTASGAPAPTYAVTTGSLPAGTTLDATSGVLSIGTTTAQGSYTFFVTASNPLGTSTQPFTLTVGTPPDITSATSTTFYTGVFNNFQMTASGSPDPLFSSTGTLPLGITLLPNGILSGTTFSTGTFPLTITAANVIGPADTQAFTLTVQTGVAPGFSSAGVASFTPGVGGTFQVTTTGNPVPVLAQTATLPTGVTFNPITGVLTVAPATAAGRYTLTFTATSLMGQATQTFTLDITAPPAITSPNTMTFAGGVGGTFQVVATGAPAPTLTQTAALPAGVTFDGATGVLTVASTTAAGNYVLSFSADNVAGNATQGFVLRVVAPTLTLVPGSLPAGVVGTVYGQQLTAVGGTAPFTFSLIAGGLPPGLTLTAGGLLSGTPTTPGNYGFTVQVLDSNAGGALVGTRAYTVTVGATLPPAAPLPTRLSVSGPAGVGASVFDPNLAGMYPANATAAINPFAGLAVNVRTAVGDVDADGTPDTIFITGPGTSVRFAVVSGVDNTTVIVAPTAPFAGSEAFTGGGFVSTGDIDGDGRVEIVLSPDQGGGPRVTIFSLLPGGLSLRANFLGIEDANFRGGARTAIGDTNNDGVPDLAVAAGFLGGPRVALFNGTSIFSGPTRLVNDFFAFPGTDATTLRNGAFVAIGDINGDGFGDLIFGGGPGGAPRVFILSGQLVTAGNISEAYASPVANFFVEGNTNNRGGIRVGVVDADSDGQADLVVGSGERVAANVRIYLGADFTGTGEPTDFQSLSVFGGAVLNDGIYVS